MFKIFKKEKVVVNNTPIEFNLRHNNKNYPLRDILLKFRKVFRIITLIVYITNIILLFALPKSYIVIPITILLTYSGIMIMYGVFLVIILKKITKMKYDQLKNKDIGENTNGN